MENKTRIHYTAGYLLNPQHRVTVDLVGLGGTGSQVLTMLGRFSASLVALGHPGLHVRAWDPDIVSDANIGRQLFSSSEVGQFKSACLVSRVNRFFGTDWEAHPALFDKATLKATGRDTSNITIGCVDTIKSRLSIGGALDKVPLSRHEATPYYWLDFGNGTKTGQVVLGTLCVVGQPSRVDKDQLTVSELPTVLELFPDLKKLKEDKSGPSCSLAEALTKQDLFINSTLCNLGMAILWKLFRELRITHHGCYLNLDTLSVNPIKI